MRILTTTTTTTTTRYNADFLPLVDTFF
jgi:hypothetical protein